MKERQRVATPNSPGRQRVGPHIIEEECENAEQKLQQIVNRKATKDSKPENSNVVRDKTYNRPVERTNQRYPDNECCTSGAGRAECN